MAKGIRRQPGEWNGDPRIQVTAALTGDNENGDPDPSLPDELVWNENEWVFLAEKEDLNEVREDVAELNADVNGVKQDITNLETSLSEVEQEASLTESKVTQLTTRIDNLFKDTTSQSGNLNGHRRYMDQFSDVLSTNDVDGLEDKFNVLINALSDKLENITSNQDETGITITQPSVGVKRITKNEPPGYLKIDQIGTANFAASLDGNGKVPLDQLPPLGGGGGGNINDVVSDLPVTGIKITNQPNGIKKITENKPLWENIQNKPLLQNTRSGFYRIIYLTELSLYQNYNVKPGDIIVDGSSFSFFYIVKEDGSLSDNLITYQDLNFPVTDQIYIYPDAFVLIKTGNAYNINLNPSPSSYIISRQLHQSILFIDDNINKITFGQTGGSIDLTALNQKTSLQSVEEEMLLVSGYTKTKRSSAPDFSGDGFVSLDCNKQSYFLLRGLNFTIEFRNFDESQVIQILLKKEYSPYSMTFTEPVFCQDGIFQSSPALADEEYDLLTLVKLNNTIFLTNLKSMRRLQ